MDGNDQWWLSRRLEDTGESGNRTGKKQIALESQVFLMQGEERGWKVTRRIETSTFTFVKSAWNSREDARLCFKQWSLVKRFLVSCFIARKIFPVIVRILWIFELGLNCCRVVLDLRKRGIFFFPSIFLLLLFFLFQVRKDRRRSISYLRCLKK